MVVAFVTCDLDALGIHDVDLPHHERAFEAAGLELVELDWRDPEIDWASPDLVVIRSPWNYASHRDEMRRWLDMLASITPAHKVHNPVPVVRWNLDKTYLRDLAGRGVAIVPTEFCNTDAEATEALVGHRNEEVVIKPSVSAGSQDTGRFVAEDPAAAALARAILDGGRTVMVQPHIASVATAGEVGAVCFDGEVSHWFSKSPMLGVGGQLTADPETVSIRSAVPLPQHEELVCTASEAVSDHIADEFGVNQPLLYARFDLVIDEGDALLLEAELFEPCFFFDVAPGAADRFAAAIVRRLG